MIQGHVIRTRDLMGFLGFLFFLATFLCKASNSGKCNDMKLRSRDLIEFLAFALFHKVCIKELVSNRARK